MLMTLVLAFLNAVPSRDIKTRKCIDYLDYVCLKDSARMARAELISLRANKEGTVLQSGALGQGRGLPRALPHSCKGNMPFFILFPPPCCVAGSRISLQGPRQP